MSSDSEQEEAPRAKRPRTHVFKTLTQQIQEIEVTVFLSQEYSRTDPLPGFSSFFQENITKWRELNAAEDFVQAATALTHLTQTLPQLLHNVEPILDILLGRLHITAELSLEPLFVLISTLARDLGVEFEPHFPRVMAAYAALVAEGLDRKPESLQHLFSSLSAILKFLSKQLIKKFPAVLSATAPLRYHAAPHVRRLAAAALAFLLRQMHAQRRLGALTAAVRLVLRQATASGSEARLQAGAALLFHAARGLGHDLNSHAPEVLLRALRGLETGDADPGRVRGPSGEQEAAGLAGDESVAAEGLQPDKGDGDPLDRTESTTSPAAQRTLRHAAVVAALLDLLLEHVRRDSAAQLWAALHYEALLRLEAAQAAPGDDLAALRAAASLGHVAQALAFHGGSRVGDYGPSLDLMARALGISALLESEAGRGAALRLAAALVAGHSQAAGASSGPVAYAGMASQWAGLVGSVDDASLLTFWDGILNSPAPSEVARAFGPLIVSHLLPLMQPGSPMHDEAWAVAVNLCSRLEEAEDHAPAAPLAEPVLAALARFDPGDCPLAWAALACLPAALPDRASAGARCAELARAARAALAAAAEPSDSQELRFLVAAALRAVSELGQDPAALDANAGAALDLLRAFPGDPGVVGAAAACLARTAADGPRRGGDALREFAAALGGNLRSPSARLRASTLRLLCCCRQPVLGTGGEPSDALPSLLGIEVRGTGAQRAQHGGLGREGQVAIGRLGTLLEHGAGVPGWLAATLAAGLLGTLRVRFGPLWSGAAGALGQALRRHAPEVWPVALEELRHTQREFLEGGPLDRWAAASAATTAGETAPENSTPLRRRFSAACVPEDAPGTDAATRLTHILRALAASEHALVEARARDWLPLFLAFSSAPVVLRRRGVEDDPAGEAEVAEELEDAADDEPSHEEARGGEDGDYVMVARPQAEAPASQAQKVDESGRSANGKAGHPVDAAAPAPGPRQAMSVKEWRAGLREWLALLGTLRGIRGLHRADDLLQGIVVHVRDSDPAVQQAALLCLKAYKPVALVPYIDRLAGLTNSRRLRTDLLKFPLAGGTRSARQDDDEIPLLPEHRLEVVPMLTTLLFPHMQKRSGGKAPQRGAIITYFSGGQPEELAPLLALFLEPLAPTFAALPHQPPPSGHTPLAPLPAWTWALGRTPGATWLQSLDVAALARQPISRRLGVLNTLSDLLTRLKYQLKMYLPDFMVLALGLMETGLRSLPGAAGDAAAAAPPEERASSEEGRGARTLRTQGMRLLAEMIELSEAGAGGLAFLWPRLMAAAEGWLPRLVPEAAGQEPPALMELAAVLAQRPDLAALLADAEWRAEGPGLEAAPAVDAEDPDDHTVAGKHHPRQNSYVLTPRPEAWAADAHVGSRLLEQVVAALGSPGCSPAGRAAALGVAEALVGLPDSGLAVLLTRHLGPLLAGLQALIVAVWQQQTGRGGNPHLLSGAGAGARAKRGSPGGADPQALAARALDLLVVVGQEAATPALACQLTAALLPMLAAPGGKLTEAQLRLVVRALAVLAALWRRCAVTADAGASAAAPTVAEGSDLLRRVLAALGPLAGRPEPALARVLADAAAACAGALGCPAHIAAARTLVELASLDPAGVDDPDYDRRLAAFLSLKARVWRELAEGEGVDAVPASLVLHRAASDLRNAADLGLRTAAAECLDQFLIAVVEVAGGDATAEDTAGAKDTCRNADGTAIPSILAPPGSTSPHPLVLAAQRVLFPSLKRGLTAVSQAVRSEHLALMRTLALALPRQYPGLAALASREDPEVDFWLNAAHIQLHRRARGLARLARALREPDALCTLGLGVMLGVLAPLLQAMVVEGGGSGTAIMLAAGGHEPKAGDVAVTANVTDAAVGALGALGAALPWTAYSQVLGQALRALRLHADGPAAKPVVRAVCCLLDNFHFLGGEEDGGEASDMEAIHRYLVKQVIPDLRKHLVVNSETVRAPVALAVVKVLRLLPEDAARAELPRVLQSVANLLSKPLQRIRDDARAVLVSMAVELGPAYLPFVIDVIMGACPLRGFVAHVRGYTIHAVVEGLAAAGAPAGSLDPCVPMLLPIVEADMWGELVDAREATHFSGAYKEAKRCRAQELYALMWRLAGFETHAGELLALVHQHLDDAGGAKGRARISSLLAALVRGALANAGADARAVCVFVYATLEAGLEGEESARAAAEAAAGVGGEGAMEEAGDGGAAAGHTGGLAPPARTHHLPHTELIVEAALGVLAGALRRGKVAVRSRETAPLLDPLLPLLVRALRSRHTPSVSLALATLGLLLQSALPGMEAAVPTAYEEVTRLLNGCPGTDTPLAQECFRLLAGLLRASSTFQPPRADLQLLLGTRLGDLEDSVGGATFGLLKAVLARRLVVPQVYDAMHRLERLMVRSQGASVREASAACLLQYLLDYPLGTPRLDAHLQFLLTNLTYQHETGRLAALDMICTVLKKFPDEVVVRWADTALLPLVTRLVSDASSACRGRAGAALLTLLQRAGPALRATAADFCLQWLTGEDGRLTRAALQLAGVLVEADAEAAAGRVPALLPVVGRLVAAGDGKGAEGWQEAYHALLLLEKVHAKLPAALQPGASPAAAESWAAAVGALEHPHLWVRRAAGRLILAGLAAPGVRPALLPSPGSAGALGRAFLAQLDGEHADEALAKQAVRGLVLLAPAALEDDAAAGRLPTTLWLAKRAPSGLARAGLLAVAGSSVATSDEVEADEGGGVEEDSNAEAEAKAVSGAEAASSDDEGEENGDAHGGSAAAGTARPGDGYTSLAALLRGVAALADDRAFTRATARQAALRCLAAVASRLGAEGVLPFLPILLRPLARITEPGATGDGEETVGLAREVLDHLRALVGAERMLLAHAAARAGLARQRAQRRAADARRNLVDPEAAAQMRISKQRRKKSGRAKVVEEQRRHRQAGHSKRGGRGGVAKLGGRGGRR